MQFQNAVEIFQAFQNRNGTCFPDDQIEGDEEDDEGEELNASIKLGEWKSEEIRFYELLTNIDDDGQSVLHIAVLTAAKKDSGVLKILLEPRVATRFGNGAARTFYSDPVFHDCESPFQQFFIQEANRCPRWPENVPIFDVRDSKGRTARDIAVKFKNGNAVRMLDACVWGARFSTWNERLERVFIPRGVRDTDTVEHFMELDAEEAIKVIAQGKVLKAEAVQQDLPLAGKVAEEVLGDKFLWCFSSSVYTKELFSHVIDVWRLNHSQLRPLRTSNHRNLFEICCTDGNANRVPYCREIVENVDLASQVIGEVEHTYLPNEKLEKRSEFLEYSRQILLKRPNDISCLYFHWFPGWDGTTSLSDVLDKLKGSDDHYYDHYWKQFISQRSLIVSDSDKPGYRTKLRANKLDIIQWLVDERGLKCPSVALCVLEYKTWMLRWIFETGHVDFDSKAAENGDIVKCSIGASWFVDGGAHMSVGEWLCGLACHIGALGIVKFLVLEVKVRTDAMYDGMNMLHLAVANGCVEVVRWIVQQEIVPVAAMTSEGLNVCHIAAQREPTLFMCSTAPPVAIPMIKLFLRYGCPEVDVHGHDILWHAVESGAGGVQDWAKGRLDKARNSANLRLLARIIQDESYSVQDIRCPHCDPGPSTLKPSP